jgi:hypothetical protein
MIDRCGVRHAVILGDCASLGSVGYGWVTGIGEP